MLCLFVYINLREGTNFNFAKYQMQKYADMNEAAKN
jgi:hypothetical protein